MTPDEKAFSEEATDEAENLEDLEASDQEAKDVEGGFDFIGAPIKRYK